MAKASLVTLHNAVVINDNDAHSSSGTNVGSYNKFALYLDIDSTLAPTDIVFDVEFDDGSGWYAYRQGLFSNLIYEDEDTASGLKEIFVGMCAGANQVRVTAKGTGCDGSNYFTITVKVGMFT